MTVAGKRLAIVKITHGEMDTETTAAMSKVSQAVMPYWAGRITGTNDTTEFLITRDGVRPVLAVIKKVRQPWWRVQMRPADPFIETTPPL